MERERCCNEIQILNSLQFIRHFPIVYPAAPSENATDKRNKANHKYIANRSKSKKKDIVITTCAKSNQN